MGDQPYADPTMHPPLGQWNTLYHKASSVIRHSGGSPREFIEELVSVGVASHFRHLLIFNEQKKNAPTRTEVQSGSIHFPEGEMSIDKSVIPQIIGIADTLQVDEKYACVLYYKSIEKQYRYSGWSLPTIAESLYNEERKYQLMLLCELLQFVNSNDSEHEAFVEIVKGFFELVGIEELFQELLAQLYKHAESNKILSSVVVANPPLSSQAQSFAQMTSSSSAIPQSPTTSTNCYAEEMVLLSDALFYLIYAFPTKDFYIGRFLDFLLMLTTKLRQQPLGDDKKNSFFLEPPEAVYHPAVFHTASSVMTGVLVMLFRSDEAPGPLLEVGGLGPAPSVGAGIGTGIVGGGSGRETGTQGPNLLCTPCPNPLTTDVLLSLNAKFMQFLDSYQPVSFHCAVLFFYLVFLDRNNATLCRDNLTKIAVALLNEPQAVDTAVTVLSEDAMFFMAQVLQKESIIAEYDFTNVAGALFYQLVGLFMKKSHYSRLYNPQTVKPRAFHAFFRFLASTFKAAPYLAVNFWGENFNQSYSYLNMLVTVSERHLFSNEKFGEKIWLSFLDLLTNSVVTADSGYQAYQFFDKLRMNWDYIFKGMAAYVHDFNPNAYTQFGLIGGLVGAGPGVSAIPARPLSPADVRSWENLFAFMTAVLEHSEAVRSLIGDNPSWQAIGTVFQFLMCPVPISLKAKMVSTIAAFAKSERFSSLIWELLDQSDLVTNAPDPAPIASSQSLALKRRESLVYELVWNESVMHEYPLTRAFLRMISELIKWPLPRTLGVGKRASGAIGLQPYLAFITQEVFVKFPVRGYKDLSEMWTVATECLSILHSLLENYKYNDLDSTDQFTEINGRRTLLPKQPAFMLVRDISSSDSEIFKKIVYIIEQGADTLMHKREELRHAAIFEQAVQLSLQVLISIFIHVESASLPFNLGQHLVSGIRPCAIYVAKLVGYPAYTKIPLLSVELLSCLTKTQFGLARMFYAHEERATFISALAEQLNNTEREFIAEDVVDNIDGFLKDQDLRAGSLKLAIVRFLLENITRAKPNVAQFYLGLISDFGEPDLSSNTCFNTIINKLADPDALCSTEPQLAEGCYELLYRLCADPDFCEICLEYLRDPKTNFFNTQLDLMPVETPLSFISTTYEIFARAWLFKLVAIEMYMMANNRTYVSDMLKILFSDRNGIDAADAAHEMITSRRSTAHRYILQHLSVLDYPTKEQHLPPPSFPAQMYETVPRTTNFRGVTIADLPTLVQLLIERSSQTFPGDPSSVLVKTDAEMFDILNYFRQQNLNENLMRGKIFFFASWKQLIETILYSCAAYFEIELRTEIIIELLNETLSRASAGAKSTPFLPQMATLVSTLVGRLKLDKANSVSLTDYEINGKYTLSSIALQKIFRLLLQTLSLPGLSRVMRGYLYASILDYLTITEVEPDTSSLLASQKDAHSKTWFLEELGNHYTRNKHDNYETIREFGFGLFLDLVATDAAGTGTDPWRAVALALLDKILRYDDKTRIDIARFLDDRGYLRALVDFENVGNKGNIAYALTTTEDVQAEILLFSGKIQFLQRVGQTVEGASLLWSNFLINKMIHCQFIDYMPDRLESKAHQLFKERYDSLLNPVLELGAAMLLMLRKNQEFVTEFVKFLDKHSEIISQIMRERVSTESQKLVTAIFYLLAQHQDILVSKLKNKQERFHAQLLQLLSQFRSKNTWPYSGNREQEADFALSLDILINLLQYCVCLTFYGGDIMLFSPQMKPDVSNSLRGPTPDMGVLGQIASHAIVQYHSVVGEITALRSYVRDVGTIADHVVAEIDPSLALLYMTTEERASKISNTLHALIATKDSVASRLFNILETTLSLIWRHLDHYILPYKSQTKHQNSQQQLYYQNYYYPANVKTDEQSFSTGTALSDTDIDLLREDARLFLFSPHSASPLLNQFLEIAVNKKGSNMGVLVQKIKELIREPTPLVNR